MKYLIGGVASVVFAVLFVFIWFATKDVRESEFTSIPLTPVVEEVEEEQAFEEVTVTIDSPEFDYISPKVVNVWRSYADRTLVTKLDRKEQVTLIDHDAANEYCNIRTKTDASGWIACGWIKDLPPDL